MSVGIKETKEALIGVNEVALHVATKLKDGAQFSDFLSFYNDYVNDADFKAKLQAAWEGYNAIPDEVKDIDLGEVIDLASVEITYVPKIIGALHG
jgi:hypothetical protein